MKIYREVGSLYIVNRKDAEGYERPVYEIEVDEVEPVRHGRWIDEDYVPSHTKYTCSVCGNTMLTNSEYVKKHKYCFACGAKMDEVTDEQTKMH